MFSHFFPAPEAYAGAGKFCNARPSLPSTAIPSLRNAPWGTLNHDKRFDTTYNTACLRVPIVGGIYMTKIPWFAAIAGLAGTLAGAHPKGLAAPLGSGIIPPSRLADWRPGAAVGVPGGIPTDPIIRRWEWRQPD